MAQISITNRFKLICQPVFRKEEYLNMNLMEEYDIEKWARRLGFPWVDNDEFKKNYQRLACSRFRSEVRHMISTIMPKEQVAEIKKQLLLYKLSTCNVNEKKLKKFKSVKEMEKYTQIQNLRSNLADLDSKIASEFQQIKELETKFGNLGQITQRKDEEKRILFNRLKKLRMKNKEIQKNIQNSKASTELLKSFGEISTKNSRIDKAEKSPWDKKVEKTLKSLEPGSEIKDISQNLVKLMDKKMPDPAPKSIDNILYAIDEEIVKKYSELQKYKKMLSTKEAELNKHLDLKTENSKDKSDLVLADFMFEKKLQAIKEQAKANAIKETIENMQNTQDIVSYTEQKENISKIISNIKSLAKEASFYCQINIGLLSSKIDSAEKAVKKETEINTTDDLKSAVSSLKNTFYNEIEYILKLEYSNTNVKLNMPKYLADSTILQIIINKIEMAKAFSQLNPALKMDLDEDIISKLEYDKKNNCFKIDVRIKKITNLIEKVKMLHQKNTAALKFWMNPPFIDNIPGHPEFASIRNRYVKALSSKNLFNSL